LLKRAVTLLTPTRLTHPDEWGAANRIYAETSGLPGPRNPYLTAYLVPFMRKVHAGTHKRVVAVTAAQSGKTESILDGIGARIDQRPAPILYVGPSRDFVTDQFEPRLMELLDQAETLRAKVARGKRQKKLLKVVGGVRIRLGFAGSSTSLKSDPFGLGFVDEYDEMMGNIKGQGDPLGLAEARGDTYADFVTAVVSTPSQGAVEIERDPVSGLEFWRKTDPELVQSPIWRLFQQGTRHHFAWACPHCGEYFIPRLRDLQWPKGATPAEARRGAYLQCPQGCAEPILDHHKPEMIAGGVMIAPGQTLEEARQGVNEPDVDTWSCWTSGLCSPFVTFGDRAARYLTALASGETDKVQTAVNAAFGEVYDVSLGADVPAWEEVLKRRLPYARGSIPSGGLRLFMAVDVQKFSLIYAIRAFGSRGTSWLVDHGQLYGPTQDDDVWTALADLMLTPVGGMQVERVYIDSGFRPDKPDQGSEHKVYEFCRRFSWIASPTKGKDVQHPPYRVAKIEVKPDGKKAVYSIDLVWLSTDFFKSLVVSRLRIPMGVPGALYLNADVEEDYARQLTSEARIIENGKPKWVQRARDNHFFDVEAMLAAAGYAHNVQRIPEGVEREASSGEAPEKATAAALPAPPEGDPPPPPPAAKPGGGGGTRFRFAGLGARLNR
jgi:phage terminase large subunit GpA-like protein